MAHDCAKDAASEPQSADGLGVPKPTWVVDVAAWMPEWAGKGPVPVDYFVRPADFDPWEDQTLVDRDGRVIHTIGLAEAPEYVVPITFEACLDDPSLPCEVILDVEVSVSTGAIVRDLRMPPKKAKGVDASAWPLQAASKYEHVGEVPKLPVERFRREAVAHAAMPRSRPHVDEMGYHVETVLPLLKARRAPRISSYERDVMRHYYALALRRDDFTKDDRLSFILRGLNEVFPDRARFNAARLRPFVKEMDAELDRVGPLQLPENHSLPAGWASDF